MQAMRVLSIVLLLAFLTLSLAGCSDDSEEMSQTQVQYLSHLDQARFFQNQGELKASILEARSAIKLKPGTVEPYLIISENLLTAGDAANAQRQLEEILRHQRESGEADQTKVNNVLVTLARAHFLQGDHEEALKTLDELESPDRSQDIESLILKGDINLAKENPEAAKQSYRAAMDQDSGAIEAITGLSKALYMEGNEEQARQMIEDAMAQYPDATELALWRAQMAHREGRLEVAREAYGKALEEIGKYDIMTYKKYQTMSALIDVLRKQGNAAQAMVYEEILAKSPPGTIKSNMESASESYSQGNIAKAADHLEEVLKQAPSHRQAQLLLGLIRFQQGRHEEAEELLSSVISMGEEIGPDANKLLAATKIQLKQPEEARKILEELDPGKTDPGVLALVGVASLAAGDPENGRQYIERSLEMNPSNVQLRLRYALHLFNAGDREEAIAQARKAVETKPEEDSTHLILADLLAREGKMDQARDSINRWLKAKPDSAVALTSAGDLEAATGNPAAAKKYYQQAIDASPKMTQPHIALFRLENKQGNKEAAFKQLTRAIEKQPDDRNALRSLMAFAAQNETYQDKAIELLQETTKEHTDAVSPRLVLLEHNLRQGDFETAKNRADEIEKLMDDTSNAKSVLGSIYLVATNHLLSQNEQQKAAKALQQARSRLPNDLQLALVEARLLFGEDEEQKALTLLRDVKLEHADAAEPFVLEADYRMSKGQHGQAVELYQMAREKTPSPELALKLSNALTRTGQDKKSLEVLETAVTAFPESPNLHLALAMAYQQNESQDKAIQSYERLLELSPDNVVGLNNLAWIYQEQENSRALELAKKAYELSPKSAAVADTYGWILLQSGKAEDSVPVLEAAHEMAPQAKDIALHLAEAYKATGQNDKAKAVLQNI